MPTPRDIAAIATVTMLSPYPASSTIAYSQMITTKIGPVVTVAMKKGRVPQRIERTSARTAKKAA